MEPTPIVNSARFSTREIATRLLLSELRTRHLLAAAGIPHTKFGQSFAWDADAVERLIAALDFVSQNKRERPSSNLNVKNQPQISAGSPAPAKKLGRPKLYVDQQHLLALRQRGQSFLSIARRIGVSKTTVIRELRRIRNIGTSNPNSHVVRGDHGSAS